MKNALKRFIRRQFAKLYWKLLKGKLHASAKARHPAVVPGDPVDYIVVPL